MHNHNLMVFSGKRFCSCSMFTIHGYHPVCASRLPEP